MSDQVPIKIFSELRQSSLTHLDLIKTVRLDANLINLLAEHKNLQILTLSQATIPKEDWESLAKITSLQELHLQGCSIACQTLMQLSGLIKSLKMLDLAESRMASKGADLIFSMLAEEHCLTSLDLRANLIEGGQINFSPALAKSKSLQSLDLSYQVNFTIDLVRELSAGLSQNSSLTHLNLGGNYLGVEGAKELSAALASNRSLRVLNLKENGITESGASIILKAMANSAITCLDLSSNLIRQIQPLTTHWLNLESLLSLHLLGNNFRTGLSVLPPRLEELNLRSCGISSVDELLSVFSSNTSLTKLDLASNSGFGEKAIPLFKNLPPNLKELCLEFCRISEETLMDIAPLLATNTTLQVLKIGAENLRNREIVIAILNALKENETLKEFYCWDAEAYENFSGIKLDDLIHILDENYTLQKLLLGEKYRHKGKVHQLLKRNKKLQEEKAFKRAKVAPLEIVDSSFECGNKRKIADTTEQSTGEEQEAKRTKLE